MDDIESNAEYMAYFSFGLGCLNVPIHGMLFLGAVLKLPCLMLPWLAVTLLEHLVVGVPLVVFFGVVSLYLAAQLHLQLAGAALIGSFVLAFLTSLSSWFTVYACYQAFYRKEDAYYYEANGAVSSAATVESTQPLLGNGGRGGPQPPPGHPNAGYNVGYQYPPHQSRQLPSAPPSSGVYPRLPNA